MHKRTVIFLFLVCLFRAEANAAPWVNPNCPENAWVQRGMESAQNARNRRMADYNNMATATVSGPNIVDCVGKFKNIRAGALLSVPGVSDIVSMAFNQLSAAACTQVDSLYNQSAGLMNQQVNLPANVGGVKVGLPGAGQLSNTYQPSNAVVVTNGSSGAGVVNGPIDKAAGYIQGIFK